MSVIRRFLRKLFGHTGGNVATIVGLSIIPVTMAIAGSVDFATVLSSRARLQDAADSAAIAAALDTSGTLVGQTAAAKKAFCANIAMPGSGDANSYCSTDAGSHLGSATGSMQVITTNNVQTMSYAATAQVPTYMHDLLGMQTIGISALANAGVSINTAEIAFVLDNTGSMADDNKMTYLKSSLDSVLASLLDSTGKNAGNTKVALVPFDTQVALSNVTGMTNYAGNFTTVGNVNNCTGLAQGQCDSLVNNYTSMCNNASSSCLTNNINYTTTYTSHNNTYYAVMSTSYYQSNQTYTSNHHTYYYYYVVYNITTYQVSGSTLTQVSTSSNGSYSTYAAYYNTPNGYNYQQYYGTVTQSQPTAGGYNSGATTVYKDNSTITSNSDLLGVSTSNWSGCVIDRTQPYDTQVDAPVTSNASTLYPAAKCATNSLLPIMDLTTDIAGARSYATKMTPAGNTNITIGVQWGMEVLSPTAPLSNGAQFNDKTISKYMVLLTDGLNTQNRWTTTSSQIDARTTLACANARNLGITIFTVRLEDGNSTMLAGCASQSSYYYNLSNSNQISGALGSIMKSIKKVRLTQ